MAMQEAGVQRIVGISTFALYDYWRTPAGTLLSEEAALQREGEEASPYVQTKKRQEELIRSISAANGWQWTILRPGIVFGPDRTWFYHLGVQLSRTLWVCYAPDSLLPLTYVENCAEAILLALEAPTSGATLNIVDDDLPERRRYIHELARRADPRPVIWEVPWPLLEAAARAASWSDRTLFRGRAPVPALLRPANLHTRCKPLRYSNQLARNLLGWAPRWDLAAALDRSRGEPVR
jgi:nucleoside-diphosphate-sugar epimerase